MSMIILSTADILNRLLQAIEARGFKKHGRVTQIRKLTGYAHGQVSDILSGKKTLTNRFLISVCGATGISYEWVKSGEGEMFVKPAEPETRRDSADYGSAVKVKEAALEYFKSCGLLPSVGEQVIEELAKLDKGHQLIQAGKIVNDVAKILYELGRKNKKMDTPDGQ